MIIMEMGRKIEMNPSIRYGRALSTATNSIETAQEIVSNVVVSVNTEYRTAATRSRLKLIHELISVGIE